MKVALLVHGFASKGGKGSTDKLRAFFEAAGYRVYELDRIQLNTSSSALPRTWKSAAAWSSRYWW